MTTSKQPTATKFTRAQESWANFVLDKLEEKIEERERVLSDALIPEEEWDNDHILVDLYEDEIFYTRYAEEMVRQREYIRTRYLGGNE